MFLVRLILVSNIKMMIVEIVFGIINWVLRVVIIIFLIRKVRVGDCNCFMKFVKKLDKKFIM